MKKLGLAAIIVFAVALAAIFVLLACTYDVDMPENNDYFNQYVRDAIADEMHDPGNLVNLVNNVEIKNRTIGPQKIVDGRKVREISFDAVAIMQTAQTDASDSGVITRIEKHMIKVHVEGLLFFDTDQQDYGIDLQGKTLKIEIRDMPA